VAESTAQSRAPLRFSTSVARGLREGAAIALAVLALVLLVALLSFDINDNGFTTKGGAWYCTTASGRSAPGCLARCCSCSDVRRICCR